MDRKEFLKTGGLSILAFSIIGPSAVFADNNNISIENHAHIRHGNLPVFGQKKFGKQAISFQFNSFSQGLDSFSHSSSLAVLSIETAAFNEKQNLQLTFKNNQSQILAQEGLSDAQLEKNTWTTIFEGKNLKIKALLANEGFEISNFETEEMYFLCFQGSAKLARNPINKEKGLKAKGFIKDLKITANNTILLGVELP